MTDPSSTLEDGAREVVLSREPVELFKVLKFEAMVNSGGQAKLVISDGQVLVNGDVETRKRRKLVAGDVIEFNGERLLLKSVPGLSASDDVTNTEAPSGVQDS